MSKTVIIRNVEFHYAHVFKPHSPFGTEVWDVQLRTDDADTAKQLIDVGVNMKEHEDGYFHANVKRKTVTSQGKPQSPVVVVDRNKQPIADTVMIGNGSKGHVKLFSYNWEQQGRKGTSAMLSAMQIVDLIEYEGSETVDFDVEDASDF